MSMRQTDKESWKDGKKKFCLILGTEPLWIVRWFKIPQMKTFLSQRGERILVVHVDGGCTVPVNVGPTTSTTTTAATAPLRALWSVATATAARRPVETALDLDEDLLLLLGASLNGTRLGLYE